jgi:tetratricopeptide (TPR) repeat protein
MSGDASREGEVKSGTPPNCGPILEDLLPYFYGDIDEKRAGVIEDHLRGCEPCSRELDVLRKTAGLLDNLPVVEPTSEQWATMRSSLQAKIRSGLLSGVEAAPATAIPGSLRRKRSHLKLAAAAAVVLLLIGVFSMALLTFRLLAERNKLLAERKMLGDFYYENVVDLKNHEIALEWALYNYEEYLKGGAKSETEAHELSERVRLMRRYMVALQEKGDRVLVGLSQIMADSPRSQIAVLALRKAHEILSRGNRPTAETKEYKPPEWAINWNAQKTLVFKADRKAELVQLRSVIDSSEDDRIKAYARYKLGESYERLSNPEKAKEEYERLLEKYKENDTTRKIVELVNERIRRLRAARRKP